MEKERLIELLSLDQLTERELSEISELVSAYPWFNMAHFLKLKALKQLDQEQGEELEKAAVFSSDRRHLYHWINNEVDISASSIGLRHKELEFIGENEHSEDGAVSFSGSNDAFELDADEVGGEMDEDLMGVTVKEDVDMEEPDAEEDVAFPAMDMIKEIDDADETKAEGDPVEVEKETDIPAEDKIEGHAEEDKQEELTPIFDTSPILKEIVEAPAGLGKENDTPNLIEQFISSEPGVIPANKPTALSGDVAAGSVMESDSFITDTLAQIYVKQGLFAKAIYAYERLSLKYPEKSAYFAAQIEKIENISNS